MTTISQDIVAARLALAEKWSKMRVGCRNRVETTDDPRLIERHLPRNWPCPYCDSRGWFPADWPLQVLIVEAAKDGWVININVRPYSSIDKLGNLMNSEVTLFHPGNAKNNCNTEILGDNPDPDSIMLAVYKVLTEVL